MLFLLFLLAGSVQYEVDAPQSKIAVRTDKTGVLTVFGAGHKHGILAPDFTANICADPENLDSARVSVVVKTPALRIDTPEARTAAGLEAKNGPAAEDVATIQKKMLSAPNLAAEQHPEIRFTSTSVRRRDNALVMDGTLVVRGRSRPVSLTLSIQRAGDWQAFRGEFQLRMSDFGIVPESVGGVVKVADPVHVLFAVQARPTTSACK